MVISSDIEKALYDTATRLHEAKEEIARALMDGRLRATFDDVAAMARNLSSGTVFLLASARRSAAWTRKKLLKNLFPRSV